MLFNSRWPRIARFGGNGVPFRFHGGARLTGWLAVLCLQGVAMANTDTFQLQGEGTLRWFGLKIYDARLFSSGLALSCADLTRWRKTHVQIRHPVWIR